MTEQGYFIEKEVFERLRTIEKRLHGGSDAMRDEGHKLGLALRDLHKIELHAFGSETSWSWDFEEVKPPSQTAWWEQNAVTNP